VGKRGESVEKARRRHRQADARLLGHVARDRCGVACVLFMAKADETHPFGLRETRQVRDGDADQTKDGVDVIQFQRIDDEVKTVRQFLLDVCFGFLWPDLKYICHDVSSSSTGDCVVWRDIQYSIHNISQAGFGTDVRLAAPQEGLETFDRHGTWVFS